MLFLSLTFIFLCFTLHPSIPNTHFRDRHATLPLKHDFSIKEKLLNKLRDEKAISPKCQKLNLPY